MNWGVVMKKARKRSGLTQEELAKKMFVTKSVISKLENGYHEPKISTFIDWMRNTNAQDIMIAALLSVDPIVVQEGLNLMSKLLAGFISFF